MIAINVCLSDFIGFFAAIATVVTVAEILKNNGLALEKSNTSCLLYFYLLTKLFATECYK